MHRALQIHLSQVRPPLTDTKQWPGAQMFGNLRLTWVACFPRSRSTCEVAELQLL